VLNNLIKIDYMLYEVNRKINGRSNVLILENPENSMLKKFYIWMGISISALVVGLVLLFG